MKIKNEDIENLKKLGLTSYEARAYILLTSLISSTADQISEQSKIPKSKIYNTLKELANKGYIEIEQERPLIYNVKSPKETIEKQKQILNEEIDNLCYKLNSNYESKIKQNPAPIWKINGIENIIEKEMEMINRAKKTISMRIGFLFSEEIEPLLHILKKKSKNTQINIIVPAIWKNDEDKKRIIENLNKNRINVYLKDIPPVKMIICDSEEMLHIYAKFNQENEIITHSAISIWNQYEEVAKHYQKNFEKQIKKKKNST